ncbi:NAD-dependent deacylase [candidate division KSB1 bacterium]|nr:NAD-dependent deacylase [candidate division KSB1 bacterium]
MFSEKLQNAVKSAKQIAVLTGAGISAESGVPTFRGENGLWRKYRPEELANFDAFINNPKLVWEWYCYRRELISRVKPNPGHYALVEMESIFPQFTLITQNVDNLHQLAGSRNLLELHGNIWRSRCVDCSTILTDEDVVKKDALQYCECGGLIRPDVVWFGECLPSGILERAAAASARCDVFLCIGTSALVQPAASLPLYGKRSGAFTIEINTESTVITELVDESIIGKSGDILPQLVKMTKEIRKNQG